MVAALIALKVKRFIGASYFTDDINKTFADYFKKEGFEVLAMDGVDVPFNAGCSFLSRVKAMVRSCRKCSKWYTNAGLKYILDPGRGV